MAVKEFVNLFTGDWNNDFPAEWKNAEVQKWDIDPENAEMICLTVIK